MTWPRQFECTGCGLEQVELLPALVPRTRCFGCRWLATEHDPDRRTALRAEFEEQGIIGSRDERAGAGWGARG